VIFHILTLFPEVFEGYREASILGRAAEQGLVELRLVNIRDFARDRHRTCDDATYGGGAGMVLKPAPLAAALRSIPAVCPSAEGRGVRVIYLTPSGRLWNQSMAEEAAREGEIVLLCGRYEGIDQRIVDAFVTDEVSVGDYVLAGGEVAAMVVVDTVVRLVAGVIKAQSLAEESFRQGLLEYPQFTRPADFEGRKVPEVLLGGDHARIERWRLRQSVARTLRYRPELLRNRELAPEVAAVLEELREKGEGVQHGQDQGH
jgi:tRNA (guanine37-N1)-methyltransferase